MSPARWSQIAIFWLGWTSWEPCRSIYGVDLQKTTRKTRKEEERDAKRRVEGKMKGRASIYMAQNIRRYATVKGSTQRVKCVYAAA